MDFKLSKEQELLRDGLTKFLATRYDLEKSRSAAKTGAGWQPEIWRAFAEELGILGATLPENVGGIGGGPVELMVIAEALGHALVVEPYVDTVVVAGGLLRRAGGERATSLLEKIAAGTAIVALAATEPESGDRWQDATTTAERDGDDWILHGRKIVAMSAPLATHLLITARTADGVSLFLADLDAVGPGLTLTGYRTVDDRRAADLVLDGLRLPAGALLGEAGQAWPSLEQARDEGAAAICSEAVGCMRKVLADTVEYSQATPAVRASRSAVSRCCSIAWSTCTWSWNRPSPRSSSRCSTWRTNLQSALGRYRRPRRPSGERPASSASRPCSCTVEWA